MGCPSFVLGGDANTGLAGYVCLETELMGWESEFYAAMLAAFAFAAFLGLLSLFAVVCPGAATLFLGGENDFFAALFAVFAFAALMGWPSCFAVASPAVLAALSGGNAYLGSAGFLFLVTELVDGESDFIAAMLAAIVFAAFLGWPSCTVADCPAVLCYAALSEVLGRFWVPAAMLVWAALLDGYGGYACCVAYSLEFLFGAAMMLASLAVENTRLFILLEMVQVVFCVENWVPGSSSQKDDSDLFEWVEVESYEPEPPCTMVDDTPHVNDLVGEARRRGWCEHELMYHIFEYGVPEGFYSMEAHMKAMASAEESAETVLRGRRILELAAEEEEANSVVFPGGVLHEDNASVPESPSSSWQWPWAASGEINMWNPLLSAVTDVFSGPILDDMVSEVDMGRLAMTCHFSLDVLCMEMHQPHNFLPQVLCLDLLIPANEVSKACVSPEPVKSVQILFRGGHGLGVWDIEPHMTLMQWFSGGKQGGNLDGYFSTIGGRILKFRY